MFKNKSNTIRSKLHSSCRLDSDTSKILQNRIFMKPTWVKGEWYSPWSTSNTNSSPPGRAKYPNIIYKSPYTYRNIDICPLNRTPVTQIPSRYQPLARLPKITYRSRTTEPLKLLIKSYIPFLINATFASEAPSQRITVFTTILGITIY